jgi:diguanylate cyclase (GGDEF)-like protein/PAS domain S-box-containing protein
VAPLYQKYRIALRPILWLLLALAAIQIVVWLAPPLFAAKGIANYAPLHTLLELIAIVISVLMFAVGWGAYDKERPTNFMLLACTFGGVAILDLLHTLSYQGMPDFVTPSGPEKAIDFWLAARALCALGLLAIAFLPWRQTRSALTRWLVLAGMLLLVATVGWIGLLHPEWTPTTFIPGQGLTAFKVITEYVLCTVYIVAALRFLWQMRLPQSYDVTGLFAAVSVMALSEFFFTLYADVTDVFNLLGHIYKVIAYGFIYNSIFVDSIRRSYQRLYESKKLLQTVIDAIPARVFWKDHEQRYLGCNTLFASDAGKDTPKNVIGEDDYQMAWREQAELYRADDHQVMQSDLPKLGFEEPQTRSSGEHIWLRTSKVPLHDETNNVIGVLGIYEDITERKTAEVQLRKLSQAVEQSSDSIVITNLEAKIEYVNEAFVRNTGYSREEAIGQNPRVLQSGNTSKETYATLWKAMAEGQSWSGEFNNQRKDGSQYTESAVISPIRQPNGLITHYVAVKSDITERKAAEDKINTLAFYDALTKLPNRRLLLDRLQHALASSSHTQRNGALLLIDLDNFKTINDTLGHDIGDLLLQEVALRLLRCIRKGDTVARPGGDEFLVILEGLNENLEDAATEAKIVGEKILAALNQPYQLANYLHLSTPSIGVALFGNQKVAVEGLLTQAELAMYQSKAAGRNTLRFFDPKMQAVVTTRAMLQADMREAILKEQFVLYYQPQVTGAGQLTGAEVLLRWQHPERGMVSPAEFIPLAEDTGLILPIGHWVLDRACTQLAIWANQPAFAQLKVAVNVSARQFHQKNFVDQVIETLLHTGAKPERLKLELTESMLVDDVEAIIGKMTALKTTGVGFSLDDFGTGYSSLVYLKRLPLDQLKIDQGFVRDILVDPNDAAIAKTVIALADSMGLAVIAEGVETVGQRDVLAEMGCHDYQGYLFSRPLPLEEFEAFVNRGLTVAE